MISVITICLNSVSSVRRTIRSVLKQTVLPAEYLFVDGGSMDGTLEAIREETKAADGGGSGIRSHLLHQATKEGITEAWNMGLQAAESGRLTGSWRIVNWVVLREETGISLGGKPWRSARTIAVSRSCRR